MNKYDLENFANNPDFIPGIYNYCDKWCNRCSFTSRCLNYELTEKHFDDSESKDIKNKKFWDKISEQFRLTMEMLEEEADELGIDLNYSYNVDMEENKETIKNHPLIREAKKYNDSVNKWFKSEEKELNKNQNQLIREQEINFSNSASLGNALKISDASEIIRWYQLPILVKLERALFSRINESDDLNDEFQKDSNGSAKVVMVAIDRSIAAWGKLYNHFDESEDEILNILLHLIKLTDIIELEFPNARAFIRIGFDE